MNQGCPPRARSARAPSHASCSALRACARRGRGPHRVTAFPRRPAPSVAFLAAGVLLSGPARADAGVALAWSAPAGCPSQDDVLAETRRLLGGRIAAGTAVTARADVALAGTSDYRLRIAIGPGTTERAREVHAPTCAELGDAAALLLALAIDPIAVASAPPGASLRADRDAPPPPPAPAPLPELLPAPLFFPVPTPGSAGPDGTLLNTLTGPTALAPRIPVPRFFAPVFSPAASRPPPSPARPPAVRAHVQLAGEAGTFRDLSPMLRAGFSVAPEPLRVEATLVLAWAGKIAAPGTPEKGGELWLGAGALSACYEARLDRDGPRPKDGPGAAFLAACAGVEAGAITATSYGVTAPATGRSPWVAPTAGGLFRWVFARRVALRADLLLGVPLLQPRFRIEGIGVVHEPAEVVGRAGLGVEVDLSGP